MATLVHIVVTPGSGGGRATAVARDVRARLEQEGYAARLQAFRTLGELVQWTRTCRATFSYLVAIGGDATVSAVAEAAVRLSVPLVPVPLGFGNLFTSAFEHPGEPDAAAALLGRGDLVWTDVGVARGEMFLSHASYGYLARIQEDVERLHRPRQRYLRLLSYYQMAAKQLSDGALDSIHLEIDGHAIPGRAGLVTIVTPREALAVNAAASLAVMVRPVDGPDELASFLDDPRRNVVLLGPGGGVGQPMRDLVLAALKGERAVVLDADALTSFADEPQALCAAIKTRDKVTLMTPHEGEFRRLFKALGDEAPSKLERARRAAQTSGAVVLLKGPDTVVAAPDGRAAIADNAPPWLATAGSGDVLAGIAAGCLAQGMPGFEAAAAAVWLHGEAGTAAGAGLIAEDLPEVMPGIYRRLFGQFAAGR